MVHCACFNKKKAKKYNTKQPLNNTKRPAPLVVDLHHLFNGQYFK